MVTRWLPLVLLGCGRIGFDPEGTIGDVGGDGTSDVIPPSCVGLAATCGPTGSSSCCDSIVAPGGTFYRGYDLAGDALSGDTGAPASLPPFRLDTYEITVGRFRQFVVAGKGTQASPPETGAGAHSQIPNSGWDPNLTHGLAADTTGLVAAIKCDPLATWTDVPAGNENRPINCITWNEAAAFCIWDSGFLPTEGEWDFAAEGGDEQRAFPWSSPASSTEIDGAHASYYDGTDCVGDGQPGCAITDLVPVGSKPAGNGRWGHADLGGNVWEWILDWSSTIGPWPLPCDDDCAYVMAEGGGQGKSNHGGGFSSTPNYVRPTYRGYYTQGMRYAYLGSRCARPI